MTDNSIKEFYACIDGIDLSNLPEHDEKIIQKAIEIMKQMRAFTNDKKDWDKRIRAIQDLLIKIKKDRESKGVES